jgi:hypothetical protein
MLVVGPQETETPIKFVLLKLQSPVNAGPDGAVTTVFDVVDGVAENYRLEGDHAAHKGMRLYNPYLVL